MISNLEQMKEHLDKIKSQASGWESSSDGSYEACLHDKGYYKLQKDIKMVERLEEIEDEINDLMDEQTEILEQINGDMR
jgi:predicted  nucleic acid-binding Zn-ribbon protein